MLRTLSTESEQGVRHQRTEIFDHLALNHDLALLLGIMSLVQTGEELWMRFMPKYLAVLGASTFVIGLFDGLQKVLSAVYVYSGGLVVDRKGHRQAFLIFTGISLCGYALVALSFHWGLVLLATFGFVAWRTLSLPGTLSLVAASLPSEKHTVAIGVQSLVRRFPLLIGPVAGGLIIEHFGMVGGVRIGAGLAVLLAATAIVLQMRMRRPVPAQAGARVTWTISSNAFTPELKRLLLSDILIRFCERVHFAWVVIYAMDSIGITASAMGLLVAIEVTAAVLSYLPASYYADRLGKEPFVLGTFVLFTLSPLAVWLARDFASLSLAFAIRGLREFGEPARKSLIIRDAPPDRRGQTVGAYYLIRDGLAGIGSLLGALLWSVSPRATFAGAAALGTAGTGVYAAALWLHKKEAVVR